MIVDTNRSELFSAQEDRGLFSLVCGRNASFLRREIRNCKNESKLCAHKRTSLMYLYPCRYPVLDMPACDEENAYPNDVGYSPCEHGEPELRLLICLLYNYIKLRS
jgi:hypothetical protein